MQNFMLGIIATVVIVLGTYLISVPMDSMIGDLKVSLDKDDEKTLDALLKFKVHRIVPFILVLIIYLIGYWSGVVIG